MSGIDISKLALGRSVKGSGRVRPPRPENGEHFLKGPVPLSWLSVASGLPGRSLHVGIAIWYLAGLHKSDTVTLSNKRTLSFGVDRNAKYRALQWLERANLVSVKAKTGRAPKVTILPVRTDIQHRGQSAD